MLGFLKVYKRKITFTNFFNFMIVIETFKKHTVVKHRKLTGYTYCAASACINLWIEGQSGTTFQLWDSKKSVIEGCSSFPFTYL